MAGTLTAIVVPLGEGFDEPWHLAYVQHLAATGALPHGPDLKLSYELQTLMRTEPVSKILTGLYPGLLTHDDYWREEPYQRESRDQSVRDLKFSPGYHEAADGFTVYESHQPPLYYALCVPVFKTVSGLPLPASFLAVRLWSVLIASLLIPLAFVLARDLSGSPYIGNMTAMLTAFFPGIYPDLVRVSNDALAVPLATAVCVALVRYCRKPSRREMISLGTLLAAGLATKAFFIPILIAVLVLMLLLRNGIAAASVLAITLPGWVFYLRNAAITGSLTGLPETIEAQTSIGSSIAAATQVDWIGVVRATAASHIWTGFWSLLQFRSWMYAVVFYAFLIGAAGFALWLMRPDARAGRALAAVYAFFWIALMYYATQTFQSTSQAIIQGWYLTPFIAFEVFVFVAGASRLAGEKWTPALLAFAGVALLALTIYGTCFIAAPYYSGLTDHAPSGHLHAYHPSFEHSTILASRIGRLFPGFPDSIVFWITGSVLFLGFALIGTGVRSRNRCLHESSV